MAHFGMLMLKVAVGDKITITAEDDDASNAVEALAKATACGMDH